MPYKLPSSSCKTFTNPACGGLTLTMRVAPADKLSSAACHSVLSAELVMKSVLPSLPRDTLDHAPVSTVGVHVVLYASADPADPADPDISSCDDRNRTVVPFMANRASKVPAGVAVMSMTASTPPGTATLAYIGPSELPCTACATSWPSPLTANSI